MIFLPRYGIIRNDQSQTSPSIIIGKGEKHGSSRFWNRSHHLFAHHPFVVLRRAVSGKEICKDRKKSDDHPQIIGFIALDLDRDQQALTGLQIRHRSLGADHPRQLLRHDESGVIFGRVVGQKG